MRVERSTRGLAPVVAFARCSMVVLVVLAVAAFCVPQSALANQPCPPGGPNGCGSAQGQPCKTADGTAGACQSVPPDFCNCVPQGIPCENSGFPQCGGQCPGGIACQANPATGHCECPGVPCQQSTFPACGGICPGGLSCQGNTETGHCECPPVPCQQSAPPQCGGGCPNNQICLANTAGCNCSGPCTPCGIPGTPPCPCPGPGPCPPGCNAAPGCNAVTSQTILPPDRPGTVYVNLISSCGGAVVKQCHPSFTVPNGGMTMQEKCCALVAAIKNNPQCQAAGYCVTINDCLQNRFFKVVDQCPGAVLSMGISNDPNIFTQEGNAPIPDYEEEVITPGCTDPDTTPGNGNDIITQVTLEGTANGQPIAPGEVSHVEMDVTGATPAHAEIATGAGLSAAAIAQQLGQRLQQQGVPVQVQGRSIRIKQPSSLLAGSPIGVGIGTSDQGIRTDTREGPANLIVAAPIPTLTEWGFILAMTLLIGTGAWRLLRK